jgi:hypothetical protein
MKPRRRKPDPVKTAVRDLLNVVFAHVEHYCEGGHDDPSVLRDAKVIRRSALRLLRLAKPAPRKR